VNSLRGHFLVASSELNDPNFLRTVVLIVQHDEMGAMGLVLNRPTDATVRKVWEQVKHSPCEVDAPLYLGGPIEGPLVALHTRSEQADIEVLPGLFYTVQPDSLEKLVSQGDAPARFIAGYAGWGPEQLEGELEQGAWLVGPARPEQVLGQEVDLWEKISRELADTNLVSLLGIKHVPDDPSLN
jgi:putative transcriptional regulator